MSEVLPFEEALIHDVASFSPERLRARAEEMAFTQVTEVEVFAWALEIYGQLQAASEEGLLLKGGAAAQLYIPLERQRASVDIDLLAHIEPEAVRDVLDEVSRRLASDLPYFVFEEYTPTQPDVALPLQTFLVTVPSSLGQTTQPALSTSTALSVNSAEGTEAGQIVGRSIKVDVFYLKEPVEHTELEGVRTFALDLAFSPRCLAIGPLIGDKLLTLATKSIGIPQARASDLPKQVYDLDNLTHLTLNEGDIEKLIATVQALVDVESSFRGIRVTVFQVLDHIEEALTTFSTLDLREGDPNLRRHVFNLQSQYLREPMRPPFYGWAAKALRLSFFLQCLRQKMEGNVLDVCETIRRADELEERMRFDGLEGEERRQKRREVQGALLSALKDTGRGDWKQLKPRPPERVYWELIDLDNLGSLEAMITE
jgi:hypothetical protein